MKTEKELTLKVVFGSTKFKHQINYNESNQATFFILKKQIYEQLQQLNAITKETFDKMQISDSDDFQFIDSDKIEQLINSNDIINVKFLEQTETPSQQQLQVAFPKEAICVLYDTSGSMACSFYNDQELSRIGAVNAWFSAFADKTLVFELDHLVQLICFSSNVNVRCEFNNDFEKFIMLVDDVNATGGTALYNAIEQSITNLIELKKKYPNIILRIIALTDGEDNSSQTTAQALVKQIIENKIIIDSFVVGENCIGLKTLTHASGGRCYCPKELNQGMQLFEIETILSVEARDIGTEGLDPNINLETLKFKPFDIEGIKQCQKELKQQVEKPEVILKKYQEQQKQFESSGNNSNEKQQGQYKATRRIMKELNDYINQPEPNVKIFPSKDNIALWKALLIGPKNTCYNLGSYLLSIEFPNDYPFKPPKIKFLTNIYHCNISQQGFLCLDILQSDQWNPTLTITQVIKQILQVLEKPNPNNALESSIASLMMHEKQKFSEKLIEETLKYANQDTSTLVQQILGGDLNQMNLDEFTNMKIEIDLWIKNNRA